METTFFIFKDKINKFFKEYLSNIDNLKEPKYYNAFYTAILNDNNIITDRIDINLCSVFYNNLNDEYLFNKDIRDDIENTFIDFISNSTLQHEYIHKALGYDINMLPRKSVDRTIDKLIYG